MQDDLTQDFWGDSEKIDFFRSDFDKMEREIEVLGKEQSLRIMIDKGLENALRELKDLEASLPSEQTQSLFELCEKNVMQNIQQQFGLHYLVDSAKEGGQVSTTHNVRNGIYANDEERLRYENRGEYDSYKYHKDSNYIAINKEQSALKKQGKMTDYMTGREIKRNAGVDLDHKISAKAIHEDRARVLAEKSGAKLANTKDNLALTDSSLNRMKKDKSPEEFIAYKHDKLAEYERKMQDGSLSPKEWEKMEKLKSIDDDAFLKEAQKSKNQIDRKIDKAYYGSAKPYEELANTTLTDIQNIAKGGLKSAVAIVMIEVVRALFFELRATFKNFGNESLKDIFKRLKERAKIVFENIKANFKGIFEGSIEQSIGAFLSNLALFVINIFYTTAKRLASLIRAGFGSLIRAIKILANPPANMPKEDVAFEAAKVFVAGIITALSFLFAEGIDKLIKTICPFLAPISEPVSVMMSALIGGILSTVALYYLDKWRSGDKEAKIQVQIMTKSGEIVQFKLAQSYFVLKDAYEYLGFAWQKTAQNLQSVQSEIEASSLRVKTSLNELDSKMNELRNFTKEKKDE